jgi:predicted DNA-binding transcriptional regulator AlpA
MTRAELPAWPAMMDLQLALAYTTLGEDSFRSVMARGGVRPVDLGTSQLRWRKADIDAAIDKLPLRRPKSPPGATPDTVDAGQVLPFVDPAERAKERARARSRR